MTVVLDDPLLSSLLEPLSFLHPAFVCTFFDPMNSLSEKEADSSRWYVASAEEEGD